MSKLIENYEPIKKAARLMNIPYTTLHQYAKEGKISFAFQLRGRLWYIHKKTIELYNQTGVFNLEDLK